MNMMVSWYLADLAGYKFGFVWKSEINPCGTDDLRDNLNKYKYNIILPQIEDECVIFDEEFIKEHSYTKVIARERKHLARGIPLDRLQQLPFEGAFGWSYQDSGMHIQGVEQDYLLELPKIYSQIPFSPRITEVINQAKILAREFGDFICLHLRGGDAVYDTWIRSCGKHIKKNMPIEIAFGILKKYHRTHKIMLFSDDIGTMNALYDYTNANLINARIYKIIDFLPKYSEVERIFFEFTFMSCGVEIFSAYSHLSYLASVISRGREQNFHFKFFNESTQYQMIMENLEKIKIHPIAQALSYFNLYMLKKAENDFGILGEWINRAIELDGENLLYKIAQLNLLISEGNLEEAESLAGILLSNERFYKVFSNCVLLEDFKRYDRRTLESLFEYKYLRDLGVWITKLKSFARNSR